MAPELYVGLQVRRVDFYLVLIQIELQAGKIGTIDMGEEA